MNIGIDGSRAFTDKKTGTENYSYQLLKHLAQIDHTNTYYIFVRSQGQALQGVSQEFPISRGGDERGPVEWPQRLKGARTSNGVSSRQDPAETWPSNFHFITIPFPRFWTQVGLAKETFFGPKLDVLFVPSHTLPLIRKPGLKTVITVHDLGAEYLPATHQLKQRLYLKLMTNYQLKSATHLIAVSEATKNDLMNKVDIKPEKISVIYEGYNKKLYKPVKGQKLLQTLNRDNLKPQEYFLFIGTIQPRKNLKRLIEAYALFSQGQALRKPKLVLVGNKGWLADEIYALPKKLGIEQHVKFLGYVPDEDLPALYSGAIAFLFPSLFEGFGLPILEAMACGCPVLTSNTSSMPEVAGDGAILVNPYSIEQISQNISLLLSQKLRSELTRKGFRQVKSFSWEECARQTLNILQNNKL